MWRALLVGRFSSARPSLWIDDDAAASLSTICIRLDGLPFGLELAADRTARHRRLDIVRAFGRSELWSPIEAHHAQSDDLVRRAPVRA